MRNYFTLAAVLICLSGIALAADPVIPTDKEIIQIKTKLGTVTFLHKLHADLSKTECTTCHHTYIVGDERVKACHECHGKKATEVPKVMTAMHSTCIGCHEYTVAHGEEAGPLKKKCKLCHVK